MKTWIQLGVFALAFVVFYAGLFVGLTLNPNMGTALWMLAALIVGLNIWWIIRSNRGK